MTRWLIAIGFAPVLVGSLVGWGRAWMRLFGLRGGLGWAEQAVFGLAAVYTVGGFLAWRGWVSVPVCWSLWALGLAGWWVRPIGVEVPPAWKSPRGGWIVWLGLALAVLPIAGAAGHGSFNSWDDLMGYLVFPERLLQTGSLGSDPFCERRAVSVPGGYFFLLAALQSVVQREGLFLIEQGLSPLLAGSLAYRLAGPLVGRRDLSGLVAIAFPLAIFLVAPPINTSSIMMAGVIMLVLFWWAGREGLDPGSFGRAAGALAALAVATKTNHAAPAGLAVGGAWLAILLASGPGGAFRALAGMLLGGLPVLIFWVLEGFQNQGSGFFPFLGRGFHSSAHASQLTFTGDVSSYEAIRSALYFLRLPSVWAVSMACAVVAAYGLRSGGERLGSFWLLRALMTPAMRLAAAVLVGGVVNTIAISGMHPQRFSLSYMSAAVLLVGIQAVQALKGRMPALGSSGMVGVLVLLFGIMALPAATRMRVGVGRVVEGISRGMSGTRLDDEETVRRFAKLGEALPKETPVLVRLDRPYLLDFRGRTIWVADAPGGASLPPGMPESSDPEVVAAYLESVGIHHVVYAYFHQAGFGPDAHAAKDSPLKWDAMFARRTIAFQAALEKLGESRRRVYDDGQNFVLDLRERVDVPGR